MGNFALTDNKVSSVARLGRCFNYFVWANLHPIYSAISPFRNGTDLSNIENDCFKKFNDPSIAKNKPEVTYPLCGMELHSFMYGSVSSKRCLRRSTKIDISAGTYDQQASLSLSRFILKPLTLNDQLLLHAHGETFHLHKHLHTSIYWFSNSYMN